MLVSINQLKFGYDNVIILSDVTCDVNEGDKIGLIGNNGCGKTTLIKNLTGTLQPDGGSISFKSGLRVGYLAQNEGYGNDKTVYAVMREVFADVLEAEAGMRAIELKMAELPHDGAEYKRATAEYEKLNDFFIAKDGYSVETRIKTVLNGMGFTGLYERVSSTLSGGEKTRLALARLLLIEPELLILDEPTNHLDFATLFWLEKYLSSYKGALLVVSHDRYFLDKTVTTVWDMTDGVVSVYRGNYSKFKQLKQERLIRWRKEYELQQEKLKHMQDYVDRNLVRATTSNMAKSRIHQMANMDIIEQPKMYEKPPRFNFETTSKPYKAVLTVKGLELAYPSHKLLDNVDFEVTRGEHLAIIGANGTGKSTLVTRLVSAFQNPDRTASFGGGVTLAYYDQQSALLDGNNTVLEEIWGHFPLAPQTQIRATLGAVLLADEVEKKVSELSGGERAKLALAIMMYRKANTLILDEPTNHLDLAAREALEEGLAAFEGTLIFVSHDRYFLQKLGTKFLELENGGASVFNGTFTELLEVNEERRREQEEAEAAAKKKTEKPVYRSKTDRSNEIKRRQQIKELEEEISACESERKSAYTSLINSGSLSYVDQQALAKEVEELDSKIDALYSELFELADEI